MGVREGEMPKKQRTQPKKKKVPDYGPAMLAVLAGGRVSRGDAK